MGKQIYPSDVRRGSRVSELSLVPLDTIKKALVVETDDDDVLLETYMTSARDYIETIIDRPLDSYVWKMTWPNGTKDSDELVIIHSPVFSVEGANQSEIEAETRDNFHYFLEWGKVKHLTEAGVGFDPRPATDNLTLWITTSWEDHKAKLQHAYLTVVGEMYRHREMTMQRTAISNVVRQALLYYKRRFTYVSQ